MKRNWSLMLRNISCVVQSISTKIILVILVLILPLNIFTIVLSDMALNNVVKQTKLAVSNVMQNYISDTEDRMGLMVSLLYSMKTNDADGIIVSRQRRDYKYYLARNRFYNNVRTSITLTKTADGAFMYLNKTNDYLLWNMDSSIHSNNNIKEYIGKNSEEGITKGWQLGFVPSKYENGKVYPVIWLFTGVQDTYFGGWIELDNVANKIKKDLQYKQVDVQFTKNKIKASDKDAMVISSYFKKADIYLSVKLSNSEINGSILSIYITMRKIAITALILLPFLYYLFYRLLLRPLVVINRAHRSIKDGNSDFRISDKANSIEYKAVYESFNRMADNLKNLKIENYEKELERQRAELKNMQLQIRPHFLINAFNLIYTLAQERDVGHIQDVMIYLSDYFRYILRNDRELELFGKEQRLIEGYINMAQIRYPGSIEVTYEYDPEISFLRLPPLLLHNFVENIIKHVVKQGVVTHISLEGRYENGVVTFRVTDDGAGISKELLTQIDHKMRKGEITGTNVGMANAYRRLQYFYGEKANIEIASEIGQGTTVMIHFPYNLDVERMKASAD